MPAWCSGSTTQDKTLLMRSAQLHSKLPASCTAQCVCPRTRLAHTTVLSSRSRWFDSRSLSSTSLPSAVVAGSPLHPAANDTALLAPLRMLHLHSGIPQAQVAVPPSTRSSFATTQHTCRACMTSLRRLYCRDSFQFLHDSNTHKQYNTEEGLKRETADG